MRHLHLWCSLNDTGLGNINLVQRRCHSHYEAATTLDNIYIFTHIYTYLHLSRHIYTYLHRYAGECAHAGVPGHGVLLQLPPADGPPLLLLLDVLGLGPRVAQLQLLESVQNLHHHRRQVGRNMDVGWQM